MTTTLRIRSVDGIRGTAIILMIIFHFCYDLRYFGWVDWDVPNGKNWWPFRYIILSLFIFTLGISLSLAHAAGIQWKKFNIRLLQLLMASLAVSAMSVFLFPKSWIYFGILHFIAVASIVGLVFIKAPKTSFVIGLAIVVFYNIGMLDNQWPFTFIKEYLPDYTEDYVPFFPWLGVTLLGVAFGQMVDLKKIELYFGWMPNWLVWMGRHGLIIYLLHQPIIFTILFPLSYLFH